MVNAVTITVVRVSFMDASAPVVLAATAKKIAKAYFMFNNRYDMI